MRLSELDEIEEQVKDATRKVELAQEVMTGRDTNPLYDFGPSTRYSLPEQYIAHQLQAAKNILISLEIYMDELKGYHPDA